MKQLAAEGQRTKYNIITETSSKVTGDVTVKQQNE